MTGKKRTVTDYRGRDWVVEERDGQHRGTCIDKYGDLWVTAWGSNYHAVSVQIANDHVFWRGPISEITQVG